MTLAATSVLRAKPRGRPPLSPDRILDAAGDLFYRRGLQAVSVNDVADAAGTTKMTLYRYFPSKDALVAAWLERLARTLYERSKRLARQCAADAVGHLRALVNDVADAMAAPEFRGWPMTNIAMELTDPAHPARQVADATKADLRAHLVDLAHAAAAPNPENLADSVLLLLEGAAASRHVFAASGPSAGLRWAFEALLKSQGLAGRIELDRAEVAA